MADSTHVAQAEHDRPPASGDALVLTSPAFRPAVALVDLLREMQDGDLLPVDSVVKPFDPQAFEGLLSRHAR